MRSPVVLGAVVLAACLPPAAIPIEETTPPAVFREVPVVVEEPAPEQQIGIRPGECPAEVAEFPIPYFDDRVLVRLPMGMGKDNFVEFNPVFVRLTGEIESSNCRHEDLPGAMIYFAAMTMFAESEPDQSVQSIHDELLEAFGYPKTIALVEADYDAAKHLDMWVYEVPADEFAGKPEPAKILLSIRVVHGQIVGLVFEVHPNAWSVMVDSLVASTQQLMVRPS